MHGKFLPVEVEAIATVKQILDDQHFKYVRKYCRKLQNQGAPTGKYSHKFYAVYYNYRHVNALPIAPELDVLVHEINSALYFASPGYAAFISFNPWSNVLSISIRPILR